MVDDSCQFDWCNRSFQSPSLRDYHMEDHPEESECVNCPECSSTYTRSSLGQHFRHNPEHRPKITNEQNEIIIGLLLGDGTIPSVSGERECSMVITMTNKSFLQWLEKEMGWLVSTNVYLQRSAQESAQHAYDVGLVDSKGGDYSDNWAVRLRSHPKFTELRQWFYGENGREIQADTPITPTTAKIWYACDGGLLKHSHAQWCMQISSRTQDLDLIAELFTKAGFKPGKHGDHSVQFGVDETKRLLNWMGEPLPGFESKWRLD